MNDALKGTPVEQFSSFVPVGTPSTIPSWVPTTPSPTPAPSTGTNGGFGHYGPNTGRYYPPGGPTGTAGGGQGGG